MFGRKNKYMTIGNWSAGIRAYSRDQFKFFYHPLLKTTEEREKIKMWWIGWHFYIVHDLGKDKNHI